MLYCTLLYNNNTIFGYTIIHYDSDLYLKIWPLFIDVPLILVVPLFIGVPFVP